MKCVTGKVCYQSKDLAEEALVEARGRSHFREGSGPIAVYQCEDCGEWHFTSKGTPSELLRSTEVREQIRNQQEAEYWTRKLK